MKSANGNTKRKLETIIASLTELGWRPFQEAHGARAARIGQESDQKLKANEAEILEFDKETV
jgi:hypothetical protein